MASIDSFSFLYKEIFPILPAYKSGASRFNQDRFAGRYMHYLYMIDPRTLFISKKQLSKYVKILDDYKKGDFLNVDSSTNEYLWNAAKYVSANIHPDTQKRIWPLFTMSGYVFSGIPIVAGLIAPGKQSIKYILFFQWLNQTQNAFFNYANKNSTMPCSNNTMIKSYFLATTSAMGIAVGLEKLLRKNNSGPRLYHKLIPFISVAFANLVNLISMRYTELRSGIKIMDKSGQEVGVSKKAAQQAILQTSLTRVILPIPILVVPPIIMGGILKRRFLKRHPYWILPIHLGICTLSFAFALPLAIAIFPQKSKILKSHLEGDIYEIAQRHDDDTFVYFNKGI